MRPRAAAALRENDQLLRSFKQIATLQRIDVERPPDAPRISPAARAPHGRWGCGVWPSGSRRWRAKRAPPKA